MSLCHIIGFLLRMCNQNTYCLSLGLPPCSPALLKNIILEQIQLLQPSRHPTIFKKEQQLPTVLSPRELYYKAREKKKLCET